MSNYYYSYVTDFSNSLNEKQLMDEINNNVGILQNCYDVGRDDDVVFISFDADLSAPEIILLNNNVSSHNAIFKSELIYDNISYNDYSNRIAVYQISNKAMVMNTDTQLINWTPIQTSEYINIDPVTGIFAPSDGIYSMTYQAVITTNSSTTKIGARLVNQLNETIYTSVVLTDDLFSSETGFEGAQYENLNFIFIGGNSYKIHAKIDGNETMDFIIKICKL